MWGWIEAVNATADVDSAWLTLQLALVAGLPVEHWEGLLGPLVGRLAGIVHVGIEVGQSITQLVE